MVIDESLVKEEKKKTKKKIDFWSTVGKAYGKTAPKAKKFGSGLMKVGIALAESSADYYGQSYPKYGKKAKKRKKYKASKKGRTILIKV